MDLAQLCARWESVRRTLFQLLDRFSEHDLGYRPFPGSWSAGEILTHIANAEDGWLRYAVTRELDAWPGRPEGDLTLEAIRSYLAEVHARTKRYLASLPPDQADQPADLPWGEQLTVPQVIWHLLEHEIHHRGELSLILGMLGRQGLEV